MKSYSKYKDSGVDWIGEIPTHWNTSKIKYTPNSQMNSFIDGDWIESKDLSDEGIRYITTGNIGEGYYKEQGKGFITEDTFKELDCTEIFEGDLIISRLSLPVGRSCILPKIHDKVVTSVDNVILRTQNNFNKYFLNYQFNSPKYFEYTELISRGVTLTRISRGMLGNNPIVIPPKEEQSQIVSFLDTKTQKIDNLIQKTEKKIELLKEKRTSFINHCVTKGLNPNVEMKDSGVEWIGDIPSHWDTIRIKYITKEHRQGYYSSKPYTDEGYKVVRISDITDNHNIIVDDSPFYKLDSENYLRFKLNKGDFLFPRTGGVGRFGIYKLDYESIYGSFLIRFRFNDLIKEDLLKFVFESDIYLIQIKSEIHGGVNQNVHVENIKDCYIPIQSNEEQTQIVEYLDEQTQKIDSTIEKETQRIGLLKEYRQSLISEVVTGKIDVRDWKE